jgi:hypothetical protein
MEVIVTGEGLERKENRDLARRARQLIVDARTTSPYGAANQPECRI